MDIENPLYKYWLFYRYDVNHRSVTNRQLFIQKCKVFAVIVLYLAHICHYVFCLYKSKPQIELPVYYFEILQYFGDMKEVMYIMDIFGSNLTIWFIIILNYSNTKHYKWLHIISALNGYQTFQSIDLRDKYIASSFERKVKSLMKLTKLGLYSFDTCLILTLFSVIVIYFHSNLIYGIITLIVFLHMYFILLLILSYLCVNY